MNNGIEIIKKTGPRTKIHEIPNKVATIPPAKDPNTCETVDTTFSIPVNFPRLSSGNKSCDHALRGTTKASAPTNTKGKPIMNKM